MQLRTRYHGGVTDEARPSPLQAALARVGDRWSLLVVESLLDGARRFNDLQSALPGIAPNILSDRLKPSSASASSSPGPTRSARFVSATN